MTGKTREGYLYGLTAYTVWGLVPLYFYVLGKVPPTEMLAQRIVWSMVFLAGILTLLGRWPAAWRCVQSPRNFWTLLLTSALIAANWLTYITAVDLEVVVQASLGFFITPLVNVVLGMLFFHDRLRRLQWLALALAAAGTSILIVAENAFPWVAFSLAITFGLYGLLRKKIPVDGLVGLSIETVLLAPAALGYLVYLGNHEQLTLGAVSWQIDLLLMASGVVTTVPLFCFGQAAQRLSLSALGFLQYLSPSIQFLLALGVLGEPLHPEQLACFACIWLGLILFTYDSLRVFRQYQITQET